ncbi:MAG: PorV/PorQ family protein [Flavobacteriales bacterium]|nr:PorV/PorQ family protein [Flavobacteriales bacterium]
MMQRGSLAAVLSGLLVVSAQAGNPDRAGSAGATQLLINPWARSSGWGLANTASLKGVESMFGNVAGLAHTRKTEVLFTNTRWLEGSGVTINSGGIGQRLGESGVLGVSATVMGFGDIQQQSVDKPEGGFGTFSPTMSNIGLAYAKEFSNSIYAGLLVRVVSEAIANVRAQGICFDAGIHYVTGPNDNAHFGIALKNVGPPMQFSGDGLSVQGLIVSGSDQLTLEQRSERFELPSMLNIGGAYDFTFTEHHKLTAAANFASNSFTHDQFNLGVEYGFRRMLYLRAGFLWEKNITSAADRSTVFTGPSAGLSVDLPFGADKLSAIAFDYGYRATNPFNGVHMIGVRITL